MKTSSDLVPGNGNRMRINELECEIIHLDVLIKRVELVDMIMSLKDDKDDPLYSIEWLKKNILKLDEINQ